MKKAEKKALKVKLLNAFKKVLKENDSRLPNKDEKSLEKAIKKIVKKTSQKKHRTAKSKTLTSSKVHDTVLHPHKFSLEGTNGVSSRKEIIQ